MDKAILKSKHLNDWHLLSWIAAINSAAVLAFLGTQDLSSAQGVSKMIQFSVRCSVPLLYIAFAASSIHALSANSFTRWLLRNRRSIGLAFAAGMAWQLFFILWMLVGHWGYYLEQVYGLEDLTFQIPGYLLLLAMVITSVYPVRRKMSRREWRFLHWVGGYFLWYVVTDTYYYELTYYNDRQLIDYIYFAAGVLVFLLRVAAWARIRLTRLAQQRQSLSASA